MSHAWRKRAATTPVVTTPEWEILRDFNSGALGSSASGQADGFTNEAGMSVYTTEQVYDGAQACKVQILSGDTGFGDFGGTVRYTTNAGQGDVVWHQLAMYFGPDFDLDASRINAKFLRVETRTAANANAGYSNLYLSNGSRAAFMLSFIQEAVDTFFPMGAWSALTKNQWHVFTWCLHLDNVAESAGGFGRCRVWFNNTKIFDSPHTRTLVNATDVARALYVFTYWNLGAPADQHCYVDNIRIAKNGRPSWVAGLDGVDDLTNPEWELVRDFNTGVVGTAADGTLDGFDDEAARTVYTNEQAFEGGQSGKLQRLNSDGTGFGEYGGIIAFPSPAGEGDTVWLDAMVYFGAEADLDIMRLASKFFRIRTVTEANANSGYIDLYFSSGIRSAYMFQAIKENVFTWFPMGTWSALTKNTWHRVSVAYRLGATAENAGGIGKLQLWFNTVRILNAPDFRTLTNISDKATAFYCATQWDYPTYQQEIAWYIDRIRLAKNGTPAWALELEGVS